MPVPVTAERSLTIVALIASWWNQVSGTVLQGVETTVVGMAFVFFTLGLVILSMVILGRIPWGRAKESQQAELLAAQETTPTAVTKPVPQEEDEELFRVAAIAVALLRSQQRTAVHRPGKPQRSTWKSYGRAHQLGL
jgi:sodium pump decarboxylase gamma subunit